MANVEDIMSMKPSWDRGVTVAISPEGIEVRICEEEKKVYAIKPVPPSLSKKKRKELQETCFELAIDYFARFFREYEIAEIWDWSQKGTVVCKAKPMSNRLLNEFILRKAVWRLKFPIGFKCWKLFKTGEESNFYNTLTGHIRLKELKTGEDALDSYKKYDAFHEVLWKGILPLIGKPICSDIEQAIKDLQFLPRKIKSKRIDEFRKYEKRKALLSSNRQGDLPENLRSIRSVSDIHRLHEVEIVSDLLKWIDSIKDPIDRDLARLKYIEDPDITLREIAQRLSLSKSDVGRRIKKLKFLS